MRHDDEHNAERFDDHLTPAERELESALRGLRPEPSAGDPLAIAYDAGHDAARRQIARWRATSGALAAALVASVALVPLMRPRQVIQLQNVAVNQAPPLPAPRPDTDEPPVALANGGSYTALAMYFDLRDRVMADGARALPAPPPSSSQFVERPVPTALSAPEDLIRPLRALRGGDLSNLSNGGRS